MVVIRNLFLALWVVLTLIGCSKVEPMGLLVASSDVKDRLKQSVEFYERDKKSFMIYPEKKEYSFLVVADSHTTTDLKRLTSFFDEATRPDGNYAFCAHLGDLAETQSEYYYAVDKLVADYEVGHEDFHFYPVVGNHDITHSGWSLFNMIFGSSTYFINVCVDEDTYDLLVFLDSANGSLGKEQLELVTAFLEALRNEYRHCFVFTHNPFFRPRMNAYSSNFPREELYYLYDLFADSEVDYVFSGHIHAHGEDSFRGVSYITLDAFGEKETPARGEMARMTCKENGEITYELMYVP